MVEDEEDESEKGNNAKEMTEVKSKQEKDTKHQASFLQQLLMNYNESATWEKVSLDEQIIIEMAKDKRFGETREALSYYGGPAGLMAHELINNHYKMKKRN